MRRKRQPSTYATGRKSIAARAKSVELAPKTLEDQIARGIGPKVTFLSPRRRSIEDADWAAWLRERRDNPPPEVCGARGPASRNLETA
jgi:hypothetical protein